MAITPEQRKEWSRKAIETQKQRYGPDWAKIRGLKAAATNAKRHPGLYQKIGAMSGKMKGLAKGFASQKVGKDGLTGRARASVVGTIGGKASHRRPTE